MKAIKRISLVLLVIMILFSVFITNGIIENGIVTSEINAFKNRAELFQVVGNTTYYTVKAKEGEDTSRHIKNNVNDRKIGAKGDIFVTSRNPLSESKVIGWISKLTWIGHTAIVYDDEGKETIEITGNLDPEENVVKVYTNTWINSTDTTPQIALLRIKNTTDDQRQKIIDYAESKIGYGYNYTFLFNRENSFYCSDLVSRAAAYAEINVNYDYLAATGSDIIVSPETYIVYYRETRYEKGKAKFFVYYLVE